MADMGIKIEWRWLAPLDHLSIIYPEVFFWSLSVIVLGHTTTVSFFCLTTRTEDIFLIPLYRSVISIPHRSSFTGIIVSLLYHLKLLVALTATLAQSLLCIPYIILSSSCTFTVSSL